MNNLYYLIPTLATVIVSLLIVRVGAVALMMTGMTPDKAKFQALSAFTGTGFTTREGGTGDEQSTASQDSLATDGLG